MSANASSEGTAFPKGSAIETLRERIDSLIEQADQMDGEEWAVKMLPLAFEASSLLARLDALYQAAKDAVDEARRSPETFELHALADAVRGVDGT